MFWSKVLRALFSHSSITREGSLRLKHNPYQSSRHNLYIAAVNSSQMISVAGESRPRVFSFLLPHRDSFGGGYIKQQMLRRHLFTAVRGVCCTKRVGLSKGST